MPATLPLISVCLATYNGASKILKTLNAIAANTILPKEIVVFVDGSTDHTSAELAQFRLQDLLTVHYSENVGRASARNRAAHLAQNELLLFLDDDILIPENTLETHANFHLENKGKILTCPTLTVLSNNDFSNFKRSVEQGWNKVASDSTDVTFSAAFFSISKTVFEQTGGFHPGLNDAEDYEFGWRLRQQNISVSVEKTLIGIHNDPISCASFIRRNRQYAAANQLLIEHQLLNVNKYIPPTPNRFKKLFFYCLTQRFWVHLVDRNLLKWLYRPLRFKLYDYISAGFIYYYPNKPLK
jgi:glycosyltransferase involved in cell wall biosynthesis